MSLIADALKKAEEKSGRGQGAKGAVPSGLRSATRTYRGRWLPVVLLPLLLVAGGWLGYRLLGRYQVEPAPPPVAVSQALKAMGKEPATGESGQQQVKTTPQAAPAAQKPLIAAREEGGRAIEPPPVRPSAGTKKAAVAPVATKSKLPPATTRAVPAKPRAKTIRQEPVPARALKEASPRIAPQREEKKTGLVRLQAEPVADMAATYQRAVALQKSGNLEEARAAYERVLQFMPYSAEVHNNLGLVYQKLGKKKRALYHYEKAIEIDPRLAAAYNNLGLLAYEEGNYAKAAAAFEQALVLEPGNGDSGVNLALAYERLGRIGEARLLLETLLGRDPSNGAAHYNLARLLEALGVEDKALSHYQRFLVLAPQQSPELRRRVEKRVATLMAAKRSNKQ